LWWLCWSHMFHWAGSKRYHRYSEVICWTWPSPRKWQWGSKHYDKRDDLVSNLLKYSIICKYKCANLRNIIITFIYQHTSATTITVWGLCQMTFHWSFITQSYARQLNILTNRITPLIMRDVLNFATFDRLVSDWSIEIWPLLWPNQGFLLDVGA
jgi:hypothetical protein